MVTLNKSELSSALSAISGYAQTRGRIKILSHARIVCVDGAVMFSATNLDVMATQALQCDADAEFATCVPIKSLIKLIKQMPGDRISLSVTGGAENERLSLQSDSVVMNLPCRPAADFPKMSLIRTIAEFSLPSETLFSVIADLRDSMSTEETRFYLNGIFVDPDVMAGVLHFVATDGHIMSVRDVPSLSAAQAVKQHTEHLIIPRDTCLLLQKNLKKKDVNVSVRLSDNHITFAFNGFSVTSKLVDATFPDYKRVIPDASKCDTLQVSAGRFVASIKRVCAFVGELHGTVKLSSDAHLDVACKNAEGAGFSESMASQWRGKPRKIVIGFNPVLLSFALKTLSDKTDGKICLELQSAGDPARIYDPARPELLRVVMPMRL